MVEAEAAVAKPPAKLQRGKTSAGDLQQSPVRRKKRAPGDAAAGEDTDAAALLKEPPKIPTYRQGDRVVVVSGSKAGIVEYVGEAKALGPGLWIGIQFDEPLVEAHTTARVLKGRGKLFDCPAHHSGFYRPTQIKFETGDGADAEAADMPPARPAPAPVPQGGKMKRQQTMKKGGAAAGGGGDSAAAAKEEAPAASVDGNGPTPALPPPVAQQDSAATSTGGEASTSSPSPTKGKRRKSTSAEKLAREEAAALAEQAADIAEPPPAKPTLASACVASGRGLHTAVVKQLAQFIITAYDHEGNRKTVGGDHFHMVVHGVLPPSNIRCKVHDHGNGTYTGEYKPEVSGQIQITISLDGIAIPGSPFNVQSVTLRPEPVMCVLKGHALHSAIARKPMAFDIEFVDALGHVAYAEDLDVRISPAPVEEEAPPPPAESAAPAAASSSADEASAPAPAPDAGAPAPAAAEEGAAAPAPAAAAAAAAAEGGSGGETATGEAASPEPKARNGEERLVVGQKPLVMRGGASLDTPEVGKLLPGARVRLYETLKTGDGASRARIVLIQQGPSSKKKAENKGLGVAGTEGWITAVQKGGKARLARPHKKMEINDRRLQMELWNRRLAADRAIAAALKRSADANNAAAETLKTTRVGTTRAPHTVRSPELGSTSLSSSASSAIIPIQQQLLSLGTAAELADAAAMAAAGPSFSYEIHDDPKGYAFAYGGIYPGTLHAHGELVKVHQVQYSIGAAGTYLLHVGLRQKAAALPGSPFRIKVKPGPAHAPSTSLPMEQLPLRCVVGTKGELSIQLSDNMGNLCVEGGAPLQCTVNAESIKMRVEDKEDGTYLITWKGPTAGDFLMSATIDGVHLRGSPAPIAMLAAAPDITKSELAPEILEEGRAVAVAGTPAKLEVRLRDAFGNGTEPTPTMVLGLVLVAMPSNEKSKGSEKKSGGDHGEEGGKKPSKMTAAERQNLVKTSPSLPYEGEWDKSVFSMSYFPHEAGDFELHVWCDPDGSGTRHFLPGCPFPLHVNPGMPSASGSYIRDATSFTQLTAGDKLVLRVQTRDEYGNNSALTNPDDELAATLETHAGVQMPLVLKPHVDVHPSKQANPGGSGEGGERENKKKELSRAQSMYMILGSYEVVSPAELTLKGQHTAMIMLHGLPIIGSPLEFAVRPGVPVAAKSRLSLNNGQAVSHVQSEVLLQLVDKYGNDVERGEVRVDAKAFGPKASDCQVTDLENGQYTITFTASVPGDYRVQVRLENVDMNPLPIHVIAKDASAAEGGAEAEASAPPSSQEAARAARRSKDEVAATAAAPEAARVGRRASGVGTSGAAPVPELPVEAADAVRDEIVALQAEQEAAAAAAAAAESHTTPPPAEGAAKAASPPPKGKGAKAANKPAAAPAEPVGEAAAAPAPAADAEAGASPPKATKGKGAGSSPSKGAGGKKASPPKGKAAAAGAKKVK